jgi:uncharacterized protein HemX
MKKIAMIMIKGCMLLTFIPCQLIAQTASVTTVTENKTSETEGAAKSTVLISRLNDIRTMNKSELSSSEKKELRKEVKSIKSELKSSDGGVYLSVGAIIIILLLLILLL